MIEVSMLGVAAGVQYQGVIDKSEGTNLPALNNGVIIGRFKRGYTGKVFTVTADSYKTVLGHDPSNPSYMALTDLFNSGVSEVSVLRVGATDRVIVPPIVPPPPPNAITSPSGWYLKSHSIIGDLVTLNALKQNSHGGLKSDITHTPTATEISNFLLSTDGLAALTATVDGLLGAGVAWQLDIENKRVSYAEA